LKKAFPRAIWAEYEPVRDEPPVAAAQASFGQNVKPLYASPRPAASFSLDADFFHAEAGSLYYGARVRQGPPGDETHGRDEPPLCRESVSRSPAAWPTTACGSRAATCWPFTAALANKVLETEMFAGLAKGLEVNPEWIAKCAEDLLEHKGASLVVAGAHQPVQVHVLAYAINAKLGNIGQTIDFVEIEPSQASSISALAAAIKAGSVKTLLVLAATRRTTRRPTSTSKKLLESVPDVVRFGYYVTKPPRRPARTSGPRTTSSRGATPARSTAPSCRSSR